MRRIGLGLLVVLVFMLALAACAKATPVPPTPAPTTAAGVTPTPKPTATVAATPTLLPTVAAAIPVGNIAPGVYRTFEEAQKDWPNVVAAAKKEGKLLVSQFGSAPAPGTYNYEVYNTFQQKYGITLEYQGGRTAEQLAKLEAEQTTGRYSMDVFPSGPNTIRTIAQRGFVQPFVPVSALEPGVRWIVNPLSEGPHLNPATGGTVYLWQVNPVMINTNLVPPDQEPKSYKDLENPKWKGKVTMDDPRNFGPILDYFGYTVLPEGVAAGLGERHIKALLDNVGRLYVGTTAPGEAVMKGDAAIAVMIPASGASQWAKLPQPWTWKFLEMEEGQMGWVVSTILFKNAPHPNAAKLFADFQVTKEADDIRAKYWGAGVGRQDTSPVWPGVNPKKLFPIDYGNVRLTMDVQPALAKDKLTPWLAERGF